ncbi:MAG: hypothetical protein F4057_09115 [Acidobacteria bacterium]|nr:hypothetical protein [Acidobacteriota bacterium]MYI75456.1 hypothetical protein [Acidobacteriota bacterium]
MKLRYATAACALAALVAVALIAGPPVAGQEAADFDTPRTAWGDPDLTGIWSPGYTLTPLERPEEFGDREFLTDEEVATLEGAQDTSEGRNFRPEAGTVADVEGAYNDEFTGRGKDVIRTRRTSLIVDPPNGRIPPRTPEAIERIGEYRPRRAAGGGEIETDVRIPYPVDPQSGRYADNPEDRAPDRCMGITIPFVRGTSGTYSRFVQSPDAMAVYHEDGHRGGGYRTIYLDGRPHPPSHIRQWLGHSVGHWDGDTLVVDTTNFSTGTSFYGSSENLHLVERFTRAGADLVMYEVTVEDPTVWGTSWTAEIPLTLVDNRSNQIYEAACHEGNYAMVSILAGARNLEAQGRE